MIDDWMEVDEQEPVYPITRDSSKGERKRRKRRPSLPPSSSIKWLVLGEKITLPQSSQMDEGSDDRRCLHRTNRRREAPLRRKRHGQRRRRQKWRAWNPAAPKSQRAETPIEGVDGSMRRRRRREDVGEANTHGTTRVKKVLERCHRTRGIRRRKTPDDDGRTKMTLKTAPSGQP